MVEELCESGHHASELEHQTSTKALVEMSEKEVGGSGVQVESVEEEESDEENGGDEKEAQTIDYWGKLADQFEQGECAPLTEALDATTEEEYEKLAKIGGKLLGVCQKAYLKLAEDKSILRRDQLLKDSFLPMERRLVPNDQKQGTKLRMLKT